MALILIGLNYFFAISVVLYEGNSIFSEIGEKKCLDHFLNLNKIRIYEPEAKIQQEYNAIYGDWKNLLMKFLAKQV